MHKLWGWTKPWGMQSSVFDAAPGRLSDIKWCRWWRYWILAITSVWVLLLASLAPREMRNVAGFQPLSGGRSVVLGLGLLFGTGAHLSCSLYSTGHHGDSSTSWHQGTCGMFLPPTFKYCLTQIVLDKETLNSYCVARMYIPTNRKLYDVQFYLSLLNWRTVCASKLSVSGKPYVNRNVL